MRLVMTLLARDEADVVGAQLAFHLSAGVDFVVATDHRSGDGTRELLERHEREGHLRLLRENREFVRQGEWVTRMARLAAVDHGADWVLNTDADEFWWPRAQSLKEALAAVPPRTSVVRALIRSFVPRPDDGRPFAERMTVRLAAAAAINAASTPYRPATHVAHRGHPEVVVGQGSHDVSGMPSEPLAGWFPVEVLHFPFRSRAQLAAKHRNTLAAWRGNLRGDLARARRYADEGRPDAFYQDVVVDDAMLRRGLAAGSLVEDTRLRDRLRGLADDGRASPTPFPRPSSAELLGLAIDAAVAGDAEAVRLQRRLDELEPRLQMLEQRARRRLRGRAA